MGIKSSSEKVDLSLGSECQHLDMKKQLKIVGTNVLTNNYFVYCSQNPLIKSPSEVDIHQHRTLVVLRAATTACIKQPQTMHNRINKHVQLAVKAPKFRCFTVRILMVLAHLCCCNVVSMEYHSALKTDSHPAGLIICQANIIVGEQKQRFWGIRSKLVNIGSYKHLCTYKHHG